MTTKTQTSVKERICDAFLNIMTYKPFIDITVSDIVSKANVARASFYRNFSSSSDVFDYTIKRIVLRLYEIANPVLDSKDEDLWRNFLFEYISFLMQSQQEYLLISSENLSLVLDRLLQTLRDFFPQKEGLSLSKRYDTFAKLSLVNGVLIMWRRTGMKESSEEIVDYLMSVLSRF